MTNYIEILVTLGFLGGLMWGMMKFMLRDIHRDLGDIRSEISEIKVEIKRHDARIDHLFAETNRLYGVCIDLLKDRK